MPSRRHVLRYLTATGAAAVAGGAALLPRRANAYYSGPISDHFNGEQFFNPGGKHPQSARRLWHLYTQETWAKWPARIDIARRDKPPTSVPANRARIAFAGHASWLIQTGPKNLLVDPVWSDRASPISFAGPKRVAPPGIAFDDLPPIHAVLVTHNHYDHLDLGTLARIWQRDRPVIVTPLGNDAIMRQTLPQARFVVLDWDHTTELAPGLVVHAEPTQHWSARGLRDRRHALWASFVIESAAGKIYAVGDSGLGDGGTFRRIGKRHPDIALALLPIGAYEPRWFMADQHMNPADAVEAFVLSGAKRALGHHWGTFQLTTEAHDQPPADLARALAGKGIDASAFRAVTPGDVVEL